MKYLDLIRKQLNEKKNDFKELMIKDGVTVEEIEAATEELETLKAKALALEGIEEDEEDDFENSMKNGSARKMSDGDGDADDSTRDEEYANAFYKAFSGKKITSEEKNLLDAQGALSTTTGADGGYLLPKDDKTEVRELKRSLPSLEKYVTVEPVKTMSGSRNIEKDALSTPFEEFTDANGFKNTDSPQFENIPFTIKDRGGILPVPNNLFNDTTGLRKYLNKWLAKKSVATRNSLIISILSSLDKKVVADYDNVKEMYNIDLDPAIALNAKVFTNQSGYNYLDTLKDSDGKYILKQNPLDPKNMLLDGKYEVVVFSDKVLKNRTDATKIKAPIIIGDLEEAIVLFDRDQISLLATNVGGDAFKFNRTDIRAITREDVKKFDSAAVVFGEAEVGTVE